MSSDRAINIERKVQFLMMLILLAVKLLSWYQLSYLMRTINFIVYINFFITNAIAMSWFDMSISDKVRLIQMSPGSRAPKSPGMMRSVFWCAQSERLSLAVRVTPRVAGALGASASLSVFIIDICVSHALSLHAPVSFWHAHIQESKFVSWKEKVQLFLIWIKILSLLKLNHLMLLNQWQVLSNLHRSQT